MNLPVTVGGYIIAVALLWGLNNAYQKIGAAEAKCNLDKQEAVAEAIRVTKETKDAAAEAELQAANRRAEIAEDARELAEIEAANAKAKEAEAVATIEQLMNEVESGNESVPIEKLCLVVDVPDTALSSLR